MLLHMALFLFLWLSNVPLYHICIIHFSVDGHLSYFHVLANVNSVIMKIGYMCIYES